MLKKYYKMFKFCYKKVIKNYYKKSCPLTEIAL